LVISTFFLVFACPIASAEIDDTNDLEETTIFTPQYVKLYFACEDEETNGTEKLTPVPPGAMGSDSLSRTVIGTDEVIWATRPIKALCMEVIEGFFFNICMEVSNRDNIQFELELHALHMDSVFDPQVEEDKIIGSTNYEISGIHPRIRVSIGSHVSLIEDDQLSFYDELRVHLKIRCNFAQIRFLYHDETNPSYIEVKCNSMVSGLISEPYLDSDKNQVYGCCAIVPAFGECDVVDYKIIITGPVRPEKIYYEELVYSEIIQVDWQWNYRDSEGINGMYSFLFVVNDCSNNCWNSSYQFYLDFTEESKHKSSSQPSDDDNYNDGGRSDWLDNYYYEDFEEPSNNDKSTSEDTFLVGFEFSFLIAALLLIIVLVQLKKRSLLKDK
jgi:hypothetical protein